MTDIVDHLQASLPERYTIEGEIGRGGMATVYLVRERHPSRQVAIKVLDPHLTARLGRERFLREVDLASNLTHPHIVPIFAAGDAGGLLYYVMPYVSGESLYQRIQREQQLPLGDSLRIALEVADALEYAHQRNIVHRDIKPGNILLHGDHAVVTDFGIARAISAAESEPITEAGITLGTPSYMSPEQASAETEIDGRADIYALGCVLHEMLSGAPPFGGRASQAVLIAHALDPVPSLRTTNKDVPTEVDQAIAKALAKTPDERYPSAKHFSQALAAAGRKAVTGWTTPVATSDMQQPARMASWARGVSPGLIGKPWLKRTAAAIAVAAAATVAWQLWKGGGGSAALAEPRFVDSVAVMPFDNLTGDPQYDHLSRGVTDEIITHLSHVPQLKVISRHSTEALADVPLTIPQLLDTLGVQHVLEGSLQLQANQVRVTVQHIDSTDAHLGAETYTADLTDWFEAQEDIAEQVTTAFVQNVEGLSLAPMESHAGHRPGHEAYLLGTHWLARRTPGGIRRAIAFFEDAISQDSAYAAAYAGISSAYALALTYRYRIHIHGYRAAGLALAMADRAVALDPKLAEAYSARGFIRMPSLGPVREAAADFERAHELQAGAASVHSWSSRVLAHDGQVDAAFAEAARAVTLDPLHPGRRIALAYLALHMKRYDVAIREAGRAMNIVVELMLPRAIQARALLLTGEAEQCTQMALGAHAVIHAMCLHELGRVEQASAIVDSVAAVMESNPEHDATFTDVVRAEDLASYYAWIGDAQASLQWATRAYELSPTGVEVWLLKSELFDRVRSDPQFARGVKRIRDGIWARVRAAASEVSR